MRPIIYILTLLFAFQPASWAVVNIGSVTSGELEHSYIASRTDGERSTQNRPSTVLLTASQHGCIHAMSPSSGDASNCLIKCLNYCNSIAGLALAAPELLKNYVYETYPPVGNDSFMSLIESPETQPPKFI